VPVAKASTVLFKNTADLHKPRLRDGLCYRYGLHGTPTSYTLAARIATLEHAEHCLLVPSGLAAVTLPSLAVLRPGDEVLVDSAPALGRKGGVGRSYADAPEIDGTVKILPPEKASKTMKVGDFVRARVVAADGHDLVASLV
jgi:cystathionine beta-lyase/cystathionine gamma-synthase